MWIAGAEDLFYIQNLFAGILGEDWELISSILRSVKSRLASAVLRRPLSYHVRREYRREFPGSRSSPNVAFLSAEMRRTISRLNAKFCDLIRECSDDRVSLPTIRVSTLN